MLGFHGKTDLEAFWTDAAVRQAAVQFKKERQEQARDGQGTSGVADPYEKNELHNEQEQRAKLRESMEQAGQQTPSGEGQLDRLEQLEQKREQAESLSPERNTEQ